MPGSSISVHKSKKYSDGKIIMDSGSIGMKKIRFLLMLMLIFALSVTMMACSGQGGDDEIDYSKMESIRVRDEILSQDFEGFPLSTFDISDINVIVKYVDTVDEYGNTVAGEEKEIPLTLSMIKSKDKEKLSKAGTNSITIVYGKHEYTFLLKLYDDSAAKTYKVVFYDEDGETQISVQYVKENGRAKQPNYPVKSGYTFVGWIDMDTGLNASIEGIKKDMRLKAEYQSDTYKVSYYYDINGNETLIKEVTLARDEKGENVYPSLPNIDGHTFSMWKKINDEKFVAYYKAEHCEITFVYREYKNGKYSDSFTRKSVDYELDQAISIEELNDAYCEGVSQADDYHFIGWYVKRDGNKVYVQFPYKLNVSTEMVFYADYVDINVGSDGLEYKLAGNDCIVAGYSGKDKSVVIPAWATINGTRRKVVGIGEGVFRNASVSEYVVGSGNEYFCVDNGVLYDKSKKVLLSYPSLKDSTEYTVMNETEEISVYAFYGASMLENVTLPNGLKQIMTGAFSNCTGLTEINIPSGVTSIQEKAFAMSSDNALTKVTFTGTNLKTIGEYAFSGLGLLKSIELPASLEKLGDGAFSGCNALESVATESSSFSVYKGGLYDLYYRTLYVYPAKYAGNVNPEVSVHPNCVKIIPGAFYYTDAVCITINSPLTLEHKSIVCPSLKTIRINHANFNMEANEFIQAFGEYLPESVMLIDTNKVFSLKNRTDIIVETYSDWNGYADYYNGFSYEVKDGEVYIYGYIGNEKDIEIPDVIDDCPVKYIADNAFNSHNGITSVKMPVELVYIGEKAFYNNKVLKTVIVSDGATSSLTEIGNYAFYGCEQLTSFVYPETMSINKFGSYVFDKTPIVDSDEDFVVVAGALIAYNGYGMSITIPDSVSYITTDVFRDKGFITDIAFGVNSKLKTIDSYAFMNCIGIKSIIFPVSLRSVASDAFYGCDYLYSVEFSTVKELVSVDYNAFREAGKHYFNNDLYEATEVHQQFLDSDKYTLTYKVENESYPYEGAAFVEPYAPQLPSGKIFAGWFYEEMFTENVVFPISIRENTTLYAKIKDSDYVSDGLEYSKGEGGYIITGYKGNDAYVIIPSLYKDAEIVGIAENAFGKTMVEIDLRSTVADDGTYRTNIVSVGINAFVNSGWYKNFAGDFVIYDNVLIGYKGDAKVVIVPENVTLVADGVFKNNRYIEYVQLSSRINVITEEMFYGCTSLKEVKMGGNVTHIRNKAFYGCESLTAINFEEQKSLTEIATDAFDGSAWISGQKEDCLVVCDILYKYQGEASTLHIPKNVKAISENAFMNNKYLMNVYLPKGLETIRQNAFNNVTSLCNVFLSNDSSLQYILDGAFMNCSQLRTIDLSNAKGLISIGEKAFYNCNGLQKVFIPGTVNTIGDMAFASSSVYEVEFDNNSRLLKIGKGVFENCNTLYKVVFTGSSILTSIGKRAFYGCKSLRVFSNASASITTLEDYAFYGCTSLTEMDVNENKFTSIGVGAVEGLGYLAAKANSVKMFGNILISYNGLDKIVIIPEETTVIYDEAFMNNVAIRTVRFAGASKLVKINDRAFYGCVNLSDITFPASVKEVGYQVMDGTVWYTEKLLSERYITINNTLIRYNANETIQAEIPDNVTVIKKDAFKGNSVYDILIPEGVQVSEDGAFNGIVPATWEEKGVEYTGWTLTINAVTLPGLLYENKIDGCLAIYISNEDTLASYRLNEEWSVQESLLRVIEKYNITYVVNAAEGDPIYPDVIHAMYNSKSVKVKSNTAKQFVFVGWFLDKDYRNPISYPYILDSDITVYAKCVDYDEGSNPDAYLLVELDDGTYTIKEYSDRTDKSVVIITSQSGKNIVSITGYLGYIKYEGNEYPKYVYNSDRNVFEPYNEFEHSGGDVVTYRRNDIIEEISFANNCTITEIGENAFAGLTNLKKVTFASSIKKIAENAFADCTSLSEIVFSEGMSNVRVCSGAFTNCTSLRTLTITDGIETLEDEAFAGCTNLTTIYVTADRPITLYGGAMPFEINNDLRIYVPQARENEFKSTWSAYDGYIYVWENKEEDLGK